MNKIKTWIVTAVETSETCDGKARVLGSFLTQQTAAAFVQDDMDCVIEDKEEHGIRLNTDRNKLSISTDDGSYGCEWNIEEVEVEDDKYFS